MKLRKLILVEVAVVAIVLIVVMIFVELTPYLVSSADESIGVYQGKEFRKGTATIAQGQSVRAEYFNYSTFDPAILVVNIEFQTWQSPGTLKIAVNGKVFASIVASPEKPKIDVNVISFSGADWVEPTSIYAPVFGNAISFTSEIGKGYEGDFSYQIIIRGSR